MERLTAVGHVLEQTIKLFSSLQRPDLQGLSLFEPPSTFAILIQGGGCHHKMAATKGRVNHKTTWSEVMHKSNSNSPSFSAEPLLNKMLFKNELSL